MEKIILSVVILSYNTESLLRACLKSLFENTSSLAFEVVVVDNGSTDGSVEYIKAQSAKLKPSARTQVEGAQSHSVKLKTIFNEENVGFARGNNQGIKMARGRFILLLNSDTVVHRGALSKMVGFLKRKPEAAVVGCKLLNKDGTDQASAGSFPTLVVSAIMLFKEHFGPSLKVCGSYDETREVDWVMGAALMVRKKVLDQIGLLDENIFMYMEEVEFCYRIKKAGWQVFFYPQAVVTHLGRGSSETGKRKPILSIYRGLLYFYKKHRSFWELYCLRLMLKTKAGLAFILGFLRRDDYLKGTYGQAFFLS